MDDSDLSKKDEKDEEKSINPKLAKCMEQLSLEKRESYIYITNTDQIEKLKDEIKALKEEIAHMKSKLDEKDSIIKQKDSIIEELRLKNENLANKEIKELKKIIEELREEREDLKKIIDGLKEEKEELIKRNNQQSFKIQILQNDYNKMKEASLISYLMYQLYRQFILKYEDDEIMKDFFITYKTNKLNGKKMIVNIDTKLLHRVLYDDDDENEFNRYVRENFKKAVNYSNDKKFSYENNSQNYNEITSWRNKYCHSLIKDISKYKEKNDFFLHAREEIGKLKDEQYKKFGEEVLEQIENLHRVKNDQEWLKWIEETLGIQIKDGFKDLQDGFILCKLLDHFHPDLKIKFEQSKSALKIQSNIINYLMAAEKLEIATFDLDDLRMTQNPKKVEESVLSLKNKMEKK